MDGSWLRGDKSKNIFAITPASNQIIPSQLFLNLFFVEMDLQYKIDIRRNNRSEVYMALA